MDVHTYSGTQVISSVHANDAEAPHFIWRLPSGQWRCLVTAADGLEIAAKTHPTYQEADQWLRSRCSR